MAITLHTVDNGTVNAINDAKFYEELTNSLSGVVAGASVTIVSANTLHITAGWGLILGRLFTIDTEDITAEVSASGTVNGRLKLVIDLSDNNEPIKMVTEARSSLPALTQEDLNNGGFVFEYALATYDIDEINASDIVSNTPIAIAPVSSGALRTLALMQNANITDIQYVNSLPGSPNATTLYLIPEA